VVHRATPKKAGTTGSSIQRKSNPHQPHPHPSKIHTLPNINHPPHLATAFEMDEEDGARARDGRLNEDTLVRLQHNDPDITYLVLDAATWIKGAGRTIADSRVLRRIYIDVRNDDEDHKWLHELCLGLAFHNRAIDSLSLWWRTCTYDAPIFDTLTSFFEHNCNLHFLEVEHLPPKVFNSLVGVLSKCKTSRLQRLRILAVGSVEEEEKANFFDSLQGLHSLESLYLSSFEIGMKGCTALSKLLNSLSSNITSLHLDSDSLDDACIAILGNAFIRNKKLKMLNLGNNISITATGWGTFSAVLFHPTAR